MSQLTEDSRLIRDSSVVASEMDGDLVMMSIERGEYFGISGVGSRVWELIEKPAVLREVIAAIVREFNVDEASCRTDVLAFASDLLRHKVATLC